MQVAEDLGHDHADDDQEEHHAVARHPLKSPQHHQVGLDDASSNRDSEMTWPRITTNKDNIQTINQQYIEVKRR